MLIPIIAAMLIAETPPSFDKLRADYFRSIAKANALQATFQRSLTDSQKKAQEEISRLSQEAVRKQEEMKKTCPDMKELEDGDYQCVAK